MASTDAYNIEGAVRYLRKRIAFKPEIAIICGSGLAGLTNVIEDSVSIPYTDIPNFPRSTVEGHGNELVFGTMGGHKVVALKGRFHFYEGKYFVGPFFSSLFREFSVLDVRQVLDRKGKIQ